LAFFLSDLVQVASGFLFPERVLEPSPNRRTHPAKDPFNHFFHHRQNKKEANRPLFISIPLKR
jgi:hypothetical protein